MNHIYNIEESYKQWARIPIDDFGYVSAKEISAMHPFQLQEVINAALKTRFNPNDWRNKDDKLMNFMNLSSAKNRTVMDFGCGYGADSVVFGQSNANVILADLHPDLLMIARQIVHCATGRVPKIVVSLMEPPYFVLEAKGEVDYFKLDGKLDLFWSFGVLHHTPHIAGVLEKACSVLRRPDGECRILLYSDKDWIRVMGEEPNHLISIDKHPRFAEYVRKKDPVGLYADWYDKDKIEKTVESFATVASCEYMCDDQFIGVVVRPK